MAQSPYGYATSYTPTPKKKAVVVPAKKPVVAPTAKPVRSFDPYNATSAELANYQYGLAMAGPDYSHIQSPDFQALRNSALTQAQEAAYRQATPIQNERGYQAARQKVSSEAATNFAKAFADIFSGGNSGAAGEQFSLANYGGSYLAGMAARMGQQLISDQNHSFDATDANLASKLADVMDAVPDVADKIYTDLAGQAQDWLKTQRSIVDADYKTQISAVASLIKAKRDQEKATGTGSGIKTSWQTINGHRVLVNNANGQVIKDAGIAGKGGAAGGVELRIFQGGGKVVAINPVTGKVAWTQNVGTASSSKGGGGSSSSSGAKTERIFGNSKTGYYYIRNGKKIKIKDTGQTATTAPDGAVAGTNPKGGKLYVKGTAYDVLNDLSIAQQGTQLGKWKKKAQESAAWAKTPANKSGYQEALKGMLGIGIPLDIAQAALNKLWRVPGKGGRPLKSFQERHPGQAGNTKPVSFNTTYTGGGGPSLVALLQQAGFSGEGLRIAYGIALRESGGRPEAFNGNTKTGDRSWGLFQINTLGSLKSRVKQFGLQSERDLLDPLANAKAAYQMSRGGTDFGAWGIGPNAYRSGAGMDTISQGYYSFPGAV